MRAVNLDDPALHRSIIRPGEHRRLDHVGAQADRQHAHQDAGDRHDRRLCKFGASVPQGHQTDHQGRKHAVKTERRFERQFEPQPDTKGQKDRHERKQRALRRLQRQQGAQTDCRQARHLVLPPANA